LRVSGSREFAFFGVTHWYELMFTKFIYQPLLNLTVLVYGMIGFQDLGVTIVLMTILVRTVMLPLSLKAARSQRALAEIAPEMERVKAQHPGDTTAQSAAVMRLYREHGVNPMAGCLPLVIQLPLLIGLYKVFVGIFQPDVLNLLYASVPHPSTMNHITLGVLDVSAPARLLALVAGGLQFLQARLSLASQPQTTQTAAMGKQMAYFLPLMIVVIGWNLPAGLTLYWIVTTLFSIGEQLYLKRRSGILAS
jgi:YidC/Oxa1 family membrane protein insertase